MASLSKNHDGADAIASLKSDVKHALQSISKIGSEQDMEDLLTPLKEDIEQISQALEQMGGDLKPLKNAAQEAVTKVVKDHPYASLAIAGGVGFLLARLISR